MDARAGAGRQSPGTNIGAPETKPLGTGGDMHVAFSYATQAALVSVDLDTGIVRVHKVISATDMGRAINPLSVQGQIEGGIVMALGNCLTEEYICRGRHPLVYFAGPLQDYPALPMHLRSPLIWSSIRLPKALMGLRGWVSCLLLLPCPPFATRSPMQLASVFIACRSIKMPCYAPSNMA